MSIISVYKRPFCDDFLKFCFDRFDVGIWSSRIRYILDPGSYPHHCFLMHPIDSFAGDLAVYLLPFESHNWGCLAGALCFFLCRKNLLSVLDFLIGEDKSKLLFFWVSIKFRSMTAIFLTASPWTFYRYVLLCG